MANRPHERHRIRNESRRRRPPDALRGFFVEADCWRFKRPVHAHFSRMRSSGPRTMFRLRRWHLASPLLRQFTGNRRRQHQVHGAESRHGSANHASEGGLRLRAGPHALCEEIVAFDEWNVWYRITSGDGNKQAAPHLLEEVYNLEDALLVGGFINTLIRNSHRVKAACFAQLINVIAPIMTNLAGFYRQTIYHPYAWALQYAHGAALNVVVESPTMRSRRLLLLRTTLDLPLKPFRTSTSPARLTNLADDFLFFFSTVI
jgi:Alpha-L-arabinofuranosidase C-terminal domain